MISNNHTQQTGNSLTLFIPELLGFIRELRHLPEADIPPLKNLQRFLSRAEKKSVDIHNWHDGLASLFQLEKLPAAELRHIQFSGADQNEFFYLCADPVYIQPDLNSAVLLAHEELELSLGDAQELAASINAHFIDEHWSLEVVQPHHWLMKLTQSALLTTTPLAQLKAQPIGNNLAQGNDSRYWQRIQNEIQMLLFAHPLNEKREAEGKLSVNSLWLWGEGVLPATATAGWNTVSGSGEVLGALRCWCGCAGKSLSLNDTLVIDDSGKSILASDAFVLAVQCQDLDAWLDALRQLENNWMPVLLQSLKEKKLDTIELFVGDGIQFSLNRKMLKRWWRRTKPVEHIL